MASSGYARCWYLICFVIWTSLDADGVFIPVLKVKVYKDFGPDRASIEQLILIAIVPG